MAHRSRPPDETTHGGELVAFPAELTGIHTTDNGEVVLTFMVHGQSGTTPLLLDHESTARLMEYLPISLAEWREAHPNSGC